MSPAEGLLIAGHAVTSRQIGAAIDTVVDANPDMDGQLIDSLTAIAKLAARLCEELQDAAGMPVGVLS